MKSVKQKLVVSEKRNAIAIRVELSLQTPADAVFEVRSAIQADVAAQVAEHLAANRRDVVLGSLREFHWPTGRDRSLRQF